MSVGENSCVLGTSSQEKGKSSRQTLVYPEQFPAICALKLLAQMAQLHIGLAARYQGDRPVRAIPGPQERNPPPCP